MCVMCMMGAVLVPIRGVGGRRAKNFRTQFEITDFLFSAVPHTALGYAGPRANIFKLLPL